MSHITTAQLEVELKSRDLLIKALQKFGEVITENATVEDYYGRRAKVDIALRLRDGTQQIGFIYDEKTRSYVFKGDVYGVGRILREVQKEYVKLAVTQALRRRGYVVREQSSGVLVGVKA